MLAFSQWYGKAVGLHTPVVGMRICEALLVEQFEGKTLKIKLGKPLIPALKCFFLS